MSPTGCLTMIVSIGGVLAAAKETEYLGSPTPPLPENAEE